MRKFLPVIALMLLLFSCSKEEFSVSSLSLHSNDSISIEEGRERRDSVLILSASLSDEDASYSFRAVSPDGDLSWEGPFDGSGVRRAELEITPGASFPEGTYSIIIYSDKGTEYSGSMEYRADDGYPYFGTDGLTMDAYAVESDINGLVVGRGSRKSGYRPSPYASDAVIALTDRYGNSIEVNDDLSLYVPPSASDPSQTAL